MKSQFNRFASFLAILTTVSLVASVWSATRTIREVQIVTVKEAIVMTDKQRIDLFIDELLEPKSAKCFRNILMAESNMRPQAKNKSSGAMGVGQLLASTYHNIGLKHSNDGLAQTVAAIAYVSRHWNGSMCAAWHNEQTKHNY